MPQGARFVLNSRYVHILQPGEKQSQYAMTKAHIANLVEYAGTRETVSLNFDDITAKKPATEKQLSTIDDLLQKLGLKGKDNKLEEILEYNDYVENPTVKNASELISYLSEQVLLNGGIDDISSLIEYAAERPGVVKVGEHGLFSSSRNVDLKEAKEEVSNHKGNIWTHVLSLRREDADRLGYDSQEPWRNLVLSKIDVIAQTHNIEVSNLRWYGAMHNTGHHPHIHLFVYADEEAGTKPHLSKEGIKTIKSKFANEIFREEMHNTYVNKNDYYKELKSQSKEFLDKLLAEPLKYYDSEQLSEIVDKINLLATKLPDRGKMVYGFMPEGVKNLVDDIQCHLVYDNKILNDLYMQYCNCQYNIEKMYINEPELAPVDKIKAFTVIKNDIIKHAVELRNGVLPKIDRVSYEKPLEIEMTGHNGSDKASITDVISGKTEYSSPNDMPGDNYKYSKYRKKLTYEQLCKEYPFLEDLKLEGSVQEVKFKSLDYLSNKFIRTGEICRELADCYYYGNGCDRDINTATMWYGIAADQFKDSYANYMLGQIYYNGTDDIAIDKDLGAYYSSVAYSLFKNEIENYDFFSKLEAGSTDIDYIEDVSADDAYKEYLIGRLYLKGHGIEQDYSKAYYSFSLSAENGYAHANYYIGNMFYYGLGFEQNYKESLEYYEKAAAQNDYYAEYKLGRMYLKGEGVALNLEAAEQHFIKASEKVIMANYDLAKLYETHSEIFNKSDDYIYSLYKTALEGLIEQEKDMHDSFTEIRIGNMYLNGQGTGVNVDKAIEWLSKSAEQDNPDALYQLGYIFSSEKYPVFDEDKSFECYSKALDGYIKSEEENANATAEYRIGRMFVKGIGTEVDIPQGVIWLEKAALNNNSEAAYQLYKLYSEGIGIESNAERAMNFLEISSYLDNPFAQYTLGNLKIQENNITEGVKWLEKSAHSDISYANYRLGSIYSSDEYGLYNETVAREYYAKALNLFITAYSEQPDALSSYQIGQMYLNGQGTEVNVYKAIEWLSKSAEQDNPDAYYQLGYVYKYPQYGFNNEKLSAQSFNSAYDLYLKQFQIEPNANIAYKLGSIYHYGLGVEQNIEKAIEWYKQSAEMGNAKAQEKIEEINNQYKLGALSIASTVAHFGRIINTETIAAMKQRYSSDSKVLRQEKIQKIYSGQAVDDHSQKPEY